MSHAGASQKINIKAISTSPKGIGARILERTDTKSYGNFNWNEDNRAIKFS